MVTMVDCQLLIKAFQLSKNPPLPRMVPVREYEKVRDSTLYDYERLRKELGWREVDEVQVDNTDHLVLFDGLQLAVKSESTFWVNGKHFRGIGILLRGFTRGCPADCTLSIEEVTELTRPR